MKLLFKTTSNSKKEPWKAKRLVSYVFCLGILVILCSCGTWHHNEDYDPYRAYHTEHGFRNIQVEARLQKRGVMRWLRDLMIANHQAKKLKYLPDIVQPDLDKIHHPDPDKIQLTWIGHSTFLIQMKGMNILTDPVFSDRVSPVSFIGPHRWVPPGLDMEELPPIDVVVISHNHYDHLDINTIRALGPDVTYLVPLGIKEWFTEKHLGIAKQLDWWQTIKLTGFNFTFVPAQHFSGRMLYDLNETLWGGWVIEKGGRKIYFAGDTGYSKDFKELGARIGPVDLALIPIGAYAPTDTLRYLHVNPYGSVMIHKAVKAKQSVAMHWGTFRLTSEPLGEPPLELKKALQELNVPADKFTTMKIGETREY